MVPMQKNKIMIRVQNLNDEYDGISQPLSIDMDSIAKIFWLEMNPENTTPTYKITETSITGNIEVNQMEQRRLKWKTVD